MSDKDIKDLNDDFKYESSMDEFNQDPEFRTSFNNSNNNFKYSPTADEFSKNAYSEQPTQFSNPQNFYQTGYQNTQQTQSNFSQPQTQFGYSDNYTTTTFENTENSNGSSKSKKTVIIAIVVIAIILLGSLVPFVLSLSNNLFPSDSSNSLSDVSNEKKSELNQQVIDILNQRYGEEFYLFSDNLFDVREYKSGNYYNFFITGSYTSEKMKTNQDSSDSYFIASYSTSKEEEGTNLNSTLLKDEYTAKRFKPSLTQVTGNIISSLGLVGKYGEPLYDNGSSSKFTKNTTFEEYCQSGEIELMGSLSAKAHLDEKSLCLQMQQKLTENNIKYKKAFFSIEYDDKQEVTCSWSSSNPSDIRVEKRNY